MLRLAVTWAVRRFSTSSSSVPREAVDAVVIGAGVVGLAVARELAKSGREVLVLDSASTFGTGTSSRNSEVIHAGIYYPPGSLKAKLCVRGKELLYRYCEEQEIPHKRTGKLIVATSFAEVPILEKFLMNGRENGVNDLQMMEGSEVMAKEHEIKCVKALFSPSTGIVDTHKLMFSLLGEAENYGAIFSYNSAVIGGQVTSTGLELQICETKELASHAMGSPNTTLVSGTPHLQLVLEPKLVINSAGLSAVPLAKRLIGLSQELVPSAYYARGCYFTLSNTKSPFSHLIYPLPEDGGIGVHVTLDLNGQVRFGPDVQWIDPIRDDKCFLDLFDYHVNSDRSSSFYTAIRKYFPNLKDGALEPGYSGIRPKITGPGQTPRDFVIQGVDVHGVPGLVNLFGIESPGLTSCLATAEYVVSKYAG